MNVDITLNDDEGQPVIVISNCHQPELVNIRIIEEIDNVEVSIDDLKTALRKLSTK